MKKIALIGSTGSIGRQVIEVVKRYPTEYKIVAMCAFANGEEFKKQVDLIKPELFALASLDRQKSIAIAQYQNADIVFNATGGFAGLEYSLAAINAKKTLALANKETLICGSDIILPLAKNFGVDIIPVDSEHSAIWQCLNFKKDAKVRRLIITASGGAFRGKSFATLSTVTPEQALAHPTWKMGKKITIDSATLMNKGYEVIEANKLFGVDYANIECVIQPQSIIHSMVEFSDGASLAQLSYPTMEVPIQLALSYPIRLGQCVQPMDYTRPFALNFEPLVRKNYPCFDIALTCGEKGGILPCVLNAADEEAVRAFLNEQIKFTDIYRVVEEVLRKTTNTKATDFKTLVEIDTAARKLACEIISRLQH